MPKQHLTDTFIRGLDVASTTWFSDTKTTGLQLCATKGGARTFYLNRWDPKAQKVRRVKLGPWAMKGTHVRWARDRAQRETVDLLDGKTMTRKEVRASTDAMPTFAQALDQYIAHRTAHRASGKQPMREQTAKDYRLGFERHLATWADHQVDALPIKAINDHLNELQVAFPYAAHRAAAIASGVVRYVNKSCALSLPIPGLLDNTRMKSRVEAGKLDMSVPWADRWATIDECNDPIVRAALRVTALSGSRWKGALQTITWDQVDLEAGTIHFSQLKKQGTDRVIVIAEDVVRILQSIRDGRGDKSDLVFPSCRMMPVDRTYQRAQIDKLPRVGITNAGDWRHYWMSVAREVADRHVHRWLSQQTMTDGDLAMLGHYGEPSRDEQKRGCEAIAAAFRAKLTTPTSVVEIRSTAT